MPVTCEPGQCWSEFQLKIIFLKANRFQPSRMAIFPRVT
jgi:hypothetical protein